MLGMSPNVAPAAMEPAELEHSFADLALSAPEAQPFAPGAHELRRERARELCRAAGHDAWLVEGGATLGYLTGVDCKRSERLFAYVLGARGEDLWIVPAFEKERAGAMAEQAGGAEIVAWREHESPWLAARAALAERGVRALAVEPSSRAFVLEELRAALAEDARVVCDRKLAQDVRSVKEPAEIARLRAAGVATKQAIEACAERLRTGHEERDLHALLLAAQRAMGLADPWALALFGPSSALPHGASGSRRLERGDVVLVDTGGALGGYQSDVTRTWTFGAAPSAEFERTWHAVRDAQRAAFAALRPGALAKDVDQAARAVLERAGYGPGDRLFTHRLGHGIGLEGHEPPYLDGGSAAALAAGMTFSNEPGVYRPGEFGLRLEDVVLVTPEGADVFGGWSADPATPASERSPA